MVIPFIPKIRRDPEKVIIHNLYVIMCKFGWTLEEVMDLPLTTYELLLKEIVKENKEINKRR